MNFDFEMSRDACKRVTCHNSMVSISFVYETYMYVVAVT